MIAQESRVRNLIEFESIQIFTDWETGWQKKQLNLENNGVEITGEKIGEGSKVEDTAGVGGDLIGI